MQPNNEPISTGPVPTQQPPAPQPKESALSNIGEFARFASIVIVVVVLVRIFVAQPFIVSGTSMVPTFQNSNYLIVDELTYHFQEPQRGDVIIFHPPIDPKDYYIKRIIGVPGDTVSVHNGVVTITNAEHPNGEVLTEPYITPDTLVEDVTTVVTPGNYYAMGDNRPASYDSRKWGLVPKKNIVGRAFIRLFPVKTFGILPGSTKIQ